ncbi:MAG: universal stress protein [Acidiferrobacterales bacterium]
MSIKKILVPLGSNEPSQAVLDTGLAAAQRFGAHLEVLYVRASPRDAVPYGTLLSSSMRESIIKAAERSSVEQANKAHALFEKFCAQHNIPIVQGPPSPDGVSAAWREEVGHESEALVHHALFSDLIVVARPTKASPSPKILETALLETGQPVLIVPPESQTCAASNIAIGWNASSEAVRAIAAAMPCLATADAVTVLTSEKRKQSAKELVQHLAWHGITASVREFDVGSRSVGETLLHEVRELKADLLVIGGYSHTRARQLLFGGVTRHVVATAQIPILMAH